MLTTSLLFALFCFGIITVFYVGLCIFKKHIIRVSFSELFTYITIFSLFGIVGEVFVNESYHYFFGQPLWKYHLLPVHDGNTSYLFILVWGLLGVYKYLTNTALKNYAWYQKLSPGMLMGLEAIFLELLFNGLHLAIFSEYIFYYFPDNLGPLSHLSCLQVLPFYYLFGLAVMRIISRQPKNSSKSLILFYWMIIVTFIWFI